MRKVKVAATQMSCSWNREEVLDKAEKLVRKAAAEGANIILLQELFETPYFCQKQKFEYFDLAKPLSGNAAVKRFTEVAKELQVVLPISFYEKAGNTAFNTIAIIDADGTILGTYRKTHIPDGLPYAEKFYFTPGDTGFKVWKTKYADIGVGICWDQWFPEAARSMALLGAELFQHGQCFRANVHRAGLSVFGGRLKNSRLSRVLEVSSNRHRPGAPVNI